MLVQLYFFSCGTILTQKHLITMNNNIGEEFEVPVPFFLIKHPRGNVLFDTGFALPVALNPDKYLDPSMCSVAKPCMLEKEYIVNQLEAICVAASDISYVVLSHLHTDHAGGIGAFPNATYIVQRRELEWAYVPEFYQQGAYIRADFDKKVKWLLLDGIADDNYDIFGDGTLQILFTPGHTPGTQSLLVNLEDRPAFLLASDSCYTEEFLTSDILPGLFWDPNAVIHSIARLRYLQKNKDVTIITGHDPDAWQRYKKAPEYYI